MQTLNTQYDIDIPTHINTKKDENNTKAKENFIQKAI